jgi:uncharacterized membrane protein
MAIFSLVFLTTIPGLLILFILKIRHIGFWEYLVYTVGLSVTFILFAGLAVNWTLPWLHITDKPLSLTPLLISFGILLSIFGIIAYVRNRDLSLKIKFPRLDWLNKIFFITPIIFPILSILGAITLNNGGSNYLTMIMLSGIAVYVLLVVILRDKLNEHVFPWAILFTSVSLLLMYSLRSWHISGWDINQEFYVFQITKSHMLWDINNFHNAYNACLSITILPTILSLFTGINNEATFKVVFPLLFSIVPISIYLISKKYLSLKMAYLASFFFMSQWMFSNEYPAIVREMTGLIFLSLMIHILLSDNINNKFRQLLLLLVGFSIVLSHYSLAYFSLFILIGLYVLIFLIKLLKNKLKFLKQVKITYYIDIKVILALVLFTFLWNVQITNTADNLTKVFNNNPFSIENIPFLKAAPSYSSILNEYISYPKNADMKERLALNLYDPQKTNNFTAKPIYNNYPTVINQSLWTVVNYFFKIVTLTSFLFLLVGIIYLIFRFKLRKKTVGIEYFTISFLYLFLIAISLIPPNDANKVSTLRVYQQALLLLSPIYVIGSVVIFNLIRNKWHEILIALIFVLYFLFYSTFIQRLIGGVPYTADTFSLTNQGTYYEFYYTHDSEVESATWLSKNYDRKSNIFADEVANFRLLAFGQLTKVNYEIIPSSISKDAYVYLDYRNVVNKAAFNWYLNKYYLNYNYPNDFLRKNKNLIYNNGESEIFR